MGGWVRGGGGDVGAGTAADGSVTYGGLDAAAGRLGGGLAAHGVGPESVVAVVLDRSGLLVAALLGVWRAGAAFVPVEPSYPAARIAFMLADARPAVVITSRALAAVLPPVDVPVITAGDPRPPAGGAVRAGYGGRVLAGHPA